MAEHAIADVFQVGRSGGEMIVAGVAITGDLDLHRRFPRGGGRFAGLDGLPRRSDQFVIGKHRDLKAKHVGGLPSRFFGQGLNFRRRSR